MGSYLSKLRPITAPLKTHCNFGCQENKDLGRHLVSTKHFDVGDVVFEESPLITAPCEDSFSETWDDDFVITCISCFKKIPVSMKCRKCRWPCCSEACSKNWTHSKYECELFSKLGTTVSHNGFQRLIYLRALLSKSVEPEKYKLLTDLSSEYSELGVDLAQLRDKDVSAISEFLSTECEMEVSRYEIAKLWAKFRINNYKFHLCETSSTEFFGEAAYYFGCLLSHCCMPNLEYSYFQKKDKNGFVRWNIRFYAKKVIQPGDVLSHAYCSWELKYGTIPRQIRIYARHNFICKCCRCKDKTEEGTFFQALICPKCKKGTLLPVNSVEMIGSPWDCDKCSYLMEANSVKKKLDSLKAVPYSLLKKVVPDTHSVNLADIFLEKQRDVLNQNHYLMYQCALHWLLGGNFTDVLLRSDKKAKKLFKKIMERIRIYLPLCLKYSTAGYVSKLQFFVAKTLATFIFKTSLMEVQIYASFPESYKLRICKRIVTYLESSFTWKGITPNSSTYKSNMKFLIERIGFWTEKLNMIETEIQKSEDKGLKSISCLFC